VTKYSLESLQKSLPAKKAVRTGKNFRYTDATVRLVAQETLRNGMDLKKAIGTVTEVKDFKDGRMVSNFLRDHGDIYADEMSKAVDLVGIDKEKTLAFLYAVMHMSVLDFMDDEGVYLPVKELKKLPRVMQCMIQDIEVATLESEVIDPATKKPMLDKKGNVILKKLQKVNISLVRKMEAIDALAKIMRWVGPAVVINNNTTNIATLMTVADERRNKMNAAYDRSVIEG
jgi:hypothetical protein